MYVYLWVIRETYKKLTGGEAMNIRENYNTNEILITASASAIEQMKYEIARELGVILGPDSTARANGSVGGEITKRLVRMGEEQLSGQYRIH